MKCPKCDYNTVDWADTCKRCGAALTPRIRSRIPKNYKLNPENSRIKTPSFFEKTSHDSESPENIDHIPAFFLDQEPDAQTPKRDVKKNIAEKNIIVQESEDWNKGIEPPDDSPQLLTARKEPGSEEYETAESSHVYDYSLSEQMVSFDVAPFGSRAMAFLIDTVIVMGVSLIALGAGISVSDISIVADSALREVVWAYSSLLVLSSTYFIFLHGAGGKTIGKMICGIKVVQGDGESIGLWNAFIRWIGYFVSSIFYIGFLWILFDSKSQGWHDKIAKTYVVNEQPSNVETMLIR